MSWVTDRLEDEKRAKQDAAKIRINAAVLYDELWREISDRVAEAKDAGMAVGTNGSAYQRVVLVGGAATAVPFRRPRQIRVSLANDKLQIVVEYMEPEEDEDENPLRLPLGVCKDDIVCLKHHERHLPIPEAAKLILERSLFPSTE